MSHEFKLMHLSSDPSKVMAVVIKGELSNDQAASALQEATGNRMPEGFEKVLKVYHDELVWDEGEPTNVTIVPVKERPFFKPSR